MEEALNLTIEELSKELAQEKKAKYVALVDCYNKAQRIAELEKQLEDLKEVSE